MKERDRHPHLLLWYVSATLEREEAAQIEEHLRICADCRWEVKALAATVKSLVKRSRVDHLGAEELAAFESGDRALDAARRSAIELHLHACADCREDLATLAGAGRPRESSEAEDTGDGRGAPAAGRLPWTWAAAAAGVLLLSLTIPAAPLIWRRPPAGPPPPPTSTIVLAPAGLSGGADHVLATRGPWALTLILPEGAAGGVHRVRVEDDRGAPIPGLHAPVRSDERGNLTVYLRSLPGPGRYRIVLEAATGAPPRASYAYPLLMPPDSALQDRATWP